MHSGKLIAAAIAAVTAGTMMLSSASAAVTSKSVKAQKILASLDSTELQAYSICAEQLGFQSVEMLTTALLGSTLDVKSNDIKDLNSDKKIDVYDAYFLLEFLKGKHSYTYSYTDFDATNDGIVDQEDVMAYLQYYNEAVIGVHDFSYSQHETSEKYDMHSIHYCRIDAQTGLYIERDYVLNPPGISAAALDFSSPLTKLLIWQSRKVRQEV